MTQMASPQQIIDRLTERWAKTGRLPVNCTLGRKPLPRRGGGCSACTAPRVFELDQAVAQLVNAGTFKRAGLCPHHVITSHLVAGLTFGPEAFRAQSAGQYRIDPVVEIKGALKRIGAVTRATDLSREDIEALCDKDPYWEALPEVQSAQHALERALAKFRSQIRGPRRSARGRTGALHIQAVARATATAWRVLTGRLPAKDNLKFHGLLVAAVATIFGHPVKEPNWEAATATAVEHIRKGTQSGS